MKKSESAKVTIKSKTPREKKIKAEATFEFSRFQNEIQVQAYYNYLHRVDEHAPGNEISDWLDAEKTIMARNGKR